MSQEKILPPYAASLSQSMRDIGYSLETAIADLIDNSITAEASNINIYFPMGLSDDSCIAIVDDGCGMTEDELLNAMRHGSRNPLDERDINDLGRFGLGLKTASFSQCKSLTVASRKNNKLVAAKWDIDLISQRNEWVITLFSEDEIKNLPFMDKLERHGTCILWQKLDRFLEGNDHGKATTYEKVELVERHLSLVFHRYITGDYNNQKLVIQINEHTIKAFDPFCVSHKATQQLPQEIIRIDGHEVIIQPYILPHHLKLSKQDYDFYRTHNDFMNNQGAYIYRNGRLMAWGDWFRLIPKGEATKLARVKIDFSNALDEYWTIDIKKSRAQPPSQVRERLKIIIDKIAEGSKRVHVGRGNRLFEKDEYTLWSRHSGRLGVRYSVNREHPLVGAIQNLLDPNNKKAFEDVLSIIERSIPLEAIYADYSSSPQGFENKENVSYEELKEKLQAFYMLTVLSGSMDKERFARMIFGLKPFSENREIVEKIIERLA